MRVAPLASWALPASSHALSDTCFWGLVLKLAWASFLEAPHCTGSRVLAVMTYRGSDDICSGPDLSPGWCWSCFQSRANMSQTLLKPPSWLTPQSTRGDVKPHPVPSSPIQQPRESSQTSFCDVKMTETSLRAPVGETSHPHQPPGREEQ